MANLAESHVAIIGSGNWGSAVARRVGLNLQNTSFGLKESFIKMWVHEEMINNRPLSAIINEDHENVKYLPGIKLPENVLACTDLLETVRGADVLLFVLPHQFLHHVLKQLHGHVPTSTICVSLIKGVEFGPKGFRRFSQVIQHSLEVDPNRVAVMMGANVAQDVAQDHYAETTVACWSREVAHRVAELFACPTFNVEVAEDVASVELLGALKNVFALGAGFCDGLGYGASSKAALVRQGLQEMETFCKLFGDSSHFQAHSLLGSCGIADLVATCYGGRHRRCAAEFARRSIEHPCSLRTPEETHALWHAVETDLLDGQKLQGVGTAEEIYSFLSSHGGHSNGPGAHFPLLERIHAIACKGEDVRKLLPWFTLEEREDRLGHRAFIQDL
eukprot:gene3696-4044_t